jgi:DNA-binding transcriptional ArsR family regulator
MKDAPVKTMPGEAAPVRVVNDVATLRALSDPIRLAIMRALMQDLGAAPRVMSVKELAQELDEPQTRLYRHIKQLRAVDLIQVAETRLVSGILEHRYQAAQVSLRLSQDLFGVSADSTDAVSVLAATFDTFRDTFLEHLSAGRVGFDGDQEQTDLAPMVTALDIRLSASRAAEFRARLKKLLEEYDNVEPKGTETVPVELLCVFSSPRQGDNQPMPPGDIHE